MTPESFKLRLNARFPDVIFTVDDVGDLLVNGELLSFPDVYDRVKDLIDENMPEGAVLDAMFDGTRQCVIDMLEREKKMKEEVNDV